MFQNRKLELLTVFATIGFVVLFLVVSAQPGHEFSGSDDVGSQMVSQLTGHPVDSFTPLIPQYVPPSGEIEATLFALQAAIGGIVVGWFFGYYGGLRRKKN
ncbi:MAG TPA: cobalt transport protein CbiN [Methanomicrobiales archaeon]|jgi:cobalt/nickel transport protein|nr:cobalt transport protein CbiN [Methanomicrobiales archaeon]